LADIEKVKTGIFEMLQRNTWKDIDDYRHRFQPVLNNALSMLKEHEPKKAKKVVEEYGWLFGDCPSCGSRLNNKDYPKACGKCGQALEWDGEQE